MGSTVFFGINDNWLLRSVEFVSGYPCRRIYHTNGTYLVAVKLSSLHLAAGTDLCVHFLID